MNRIRADCTLIPHETWGAGVTAPVFRACLVPLPTVGQNAYLTKTVPMTRPVKVKNVLILAQVSVASTQTAKSEIIYQYVCATEVILGTHSPSVD